jgi:hypothetical protein
MILRRKGSLPPIFPAPIISPFFSLSDKWYVRKETGLKDDKEYRKLFPL